MVLRRARDRQEEWEDTPRGRPQTPPYQWWRLHDSYAQRLRSLEEAGDGPQAAVSGEDGDVRAGGLASPLPPTSCQVKRARSW